MAHHKSAKKRIRQNEKRRRRNRHIRSTLRTAIKKLEQSIEKRDVELAQSLIRKTISTVDRAVTKGVIHRNNAARRVSRLTRKVNALVASTRET